MYTSTLYSSPVVAASIVHADLRFQCHLPVNHPGNPVKYKNTPFSLTSCWIQIKHFWGVESVFLIFIAGDSDGGIPFITVLRNQDQQSMFKVEMY